MGVNSLPKTVTRQRRGCDLNPGLLRLRPALVQSVRHNVNSAQIGTHNQVAVLST